MIKAPVHKLIILLPLFGTYIGMAIGISCVFLWPNLEDKEKVAEWVLSGRGILPLWGSISVIVVSISVFICLLFWARSLAIRVRCLEMQALKSDSLGE